MHMNQLRAIFRLPVFLSYLAFLGSVLGQEPQAPWKDAPERPLSPPAVQQYESNTVLGPNDQLTIWALGVSEIPDKPLQIDEQGLIDIPMLGRIQAAGLTVGQFKQELIKRLGTYVQSPQVSVSVTELHSRPVSVIGAVNHPGIYQLGNQKTVLEVLSVAGGLATDAGQLVKVTRNKDSGCSPLPRATETADHLYGIVDVNLKELIDSKDPDANLTLCPHDIISVPRAEMVYVVGEVQKPGAFPINERASYTVLQALTMAGGLTPTAAPGYTKILRDAQSTNRQEIPIDLKRVLGSKGEDVMLKAGDILFIPNSMAKSAGRKAVDAAIQLAVGVAVFRR